MHVSAEMSFPVLTLKMKLVFGRVSCQPRLGFFLPAVLVARPWLSQSRQTCQSSGLPCIKRVFRWLLCIKLVRLTYFVLLSTEWWETWGQLFICNIYCRWNCNSIAVHCFFKYAQHSSNSQNTADTGIFPVIIYFCCFLLSHLMTCIACEFQSLWASTVIDSVVHSVHYFVSPWLNVWMLTCLLMSMKMHFFCCTEIRWNQSAVTCSDFNLNKWH